MNPAGAGRRWTFYEAVNIEKQDDKVNNACRVALLKVLCRWEI